MKIRYIGRWDEHSFLLRLVRLMWVNDGVGSSTQISLALGGKLFGFSTNFTGWKSYFLGIRIHYDKAYGGIHA